MFEVSDYEVIEEIGRGGMATVYKALQPSLNRFVALKVLPSHFAHDPEFVTRFRREALAVAKLRHPNIVQVYNFHEEGDLFYLAMEYVEGGSLFDLMKETETLPLKFAAEITVQVAEALHHAHQKGFIHRDIKPSNILLTAERQAVLTDFGITKAIEGTKLTKTAIFGGGTSEYISPEQAKGVTIDGRADLYSLGIVWYELVTGHCPFEQGNPFAVIHSQIYDEPPKPTQYNPGIPPEMEKTILMLLEKDPDERYPNGKQLIAAINKLDLPEMRDEDFPTLIRPRLNPSETLLKSENVKTRMKRDSDPIKVEGEAGYSDADAGQERAERESTVSPGDRFSVAAPITLAKKEEPETKVKMNITAASDSLPESEEVKETEGAPADKAAAKAKSGTKKTVAKGVKEDKKKDKPAKIKPATKKEAAKAPERGSRRPLIIMAAAGAGVMAVAIIAVIAGNIIGRGGDVFHHQFRPVLTYTGGATVIREVNIQSKGDTDIFVIALKIKGGKGDIEVRESIPKSLAESVSKIDFETEPTKVIKKDPVVMWKLKPKKDGVNIIYRVAGSTEVSKEKFDRVISEFNSLPRLEKITIVSGANEVPEGIAIDLKALGIMSDESTTSRIPVSWKSDNPAVAIVDKGGSVKGIKTGSAKITATNGKLTAFLGIKVTPVLREIEIVPGEASLQVGGAIDFRAVGKFSDGSQVEDLGVAWSVSDSSVASIDAAGLLNAINTGESVVEAKSGEIKASAKVTVTQPPAGQPQSSKKKSQPSTGGSGGTDPYSVGPQPINTPPQSQPVDPIPMDVE